MGIMKNLPSFGGLTPIESALKSGSLKPLAPDALLNDTMTALRQPSSILEAKNLTGQNNKGGKTLTEQKADDAAAKSEKSRQNYINKYGDAEAFRNRVNAGLQV